MDSSDHHPDSRTAAAEILRCQDVFRSRTAEEPPLHQAGRGTIADDFSATAAAADARNFSAADDGDNSAADDRTDEPDGAQQTQKKHHQAQ